MATFTTNIPDNKVQPLVDLICDQMNFTRRANEGETEIQFAKRMRLQNERHWIRDMKRQQIEQASEVAGDNDFGLS